MSLIHVLISLEDSCWIFVICIQLIIILFLLLQRETMQTYLINFVTLLCDIGIIYRGT